MLTLTNILQLMICAFIVWILKRCFDDIDDEIKDLKTEIRNMQLNVNVTKFLKE